MRHWIVAPGNRVQLSTLPPIWGHNISVVYLYGIQDGRVRFPMAPPNMLDSDSGIPPVS